MGWKIAVLLLAVCSAGWARLVPDLVETVPSDTDYAAPPPVDALSYGAGDEGQYVPPPPPPPPASGLSYEEEVEQDAYPEDEGSPPEDGAGAYDDEQYDEGGDLGYKPAPGQYPAGGRDPRLFGLASAVNYLAQLGFLYKPEEIARKADATIESAAENIQDVASSIAKATSETSEEIVAGIADVTGLSPKKFIRGQCDKICNEFGKEDEGICENAGACLARGGEIVGSCGSCAGCGACCKFKSDCHSTTNQMLSYFQSRGYPKTRRDETSCTNTIKIRENICQVRLDFIDFEFPSPVNGRCRSGDSFEITANEHPVGVFGRGNNRLCGINTGQHLYLKAKPGGLIILKATTSGVAAVPLAITPGDLAGDTAYRWNIKVTQICCNSDNHFMRKIKAPQGCKQYFREPRGTLESFNFDARSEWVTNQYYSICIRHQYKTCGFTLNVLKFGLPSTTQCRTGENLLDNSGDLCCTTGPVGSNYIGLIGTSDGTSRPSPVTGDDIINNQPRYYYCGRKLGRTDTVRARYKGPLVIRVYADNKRRGPLACRRPEDCAGFRLNYDVDTGTC